MHNTDDKAVNWRWRSFKIINFCCNRKPKFRAKLYLAPFLRYSIAKSKTTPSYLNPQMEGPTSNSAIKLSRQRVKALGYILVKLHDPICSCFVTMHHRHRRQTTYHDNSRTLQWKCYVRLKIIYRMSQAYMRTHGRCVHKITAHGIALIPNKSCPLLTNYWQAQLLQETQNMQLQCSSQRLYSVLVISELHFLLSCTN